MHSGRFLSYSRKRKISQNDHSLSFVVACCYSLSFVITRCHSLSLVIIRCHSLSLIVTRCHLLYHSLSFVVTRCNSLSMDVSLVCLFINDWYTAQSFQNMMGRSHMPIHLLQNIQNARLQKQKDEDSSGGSSSKQNKQQESNLRWSFFPKKVNCQKSLTK